MKGSPPSRYGRIWQMTLIEGCLDRPIFKLVADTAAETGLRVRVVGGYVRDCLLGRPCNDIDFVVEGGGTRFAEAVAGKAGARVTVFANFGTAMFHYMGDEIEFVGARKESYDRTSRNPIVEDGTFEEDQARRDFTINAMAISLSGDSFGELIDPFGGVRDLSEGIIRTPLDPDITFSDDPLRMFRAVRFACRLSRPGQPFRIEPGCFAAIRRNVHRIGILSKERIVEELNKILLCETPSTGFRLLDAAGLLEPVLPELVRLKGTETIDGRGHKENFSHTLQVVDNVAAAEILAIAEGRLSDWTVSGDGAGSVAVPRTEPNVWLRWAALLHDVGKADTRRYSPATGWTFHGHEVVGGRIVDRIFRRLAMPLNEKLKYVRKLVELHLRPIALVDEGVTDSAVRRLIFDAGDELDDLMLLCNADITSKNPAKVARIKANFALVLEKIKMVEERDAIRNFKNPITGDYVMEVYGIGPSQVIGILKEYVKNAILDGLIPNEFDAADKLMRSKASELGLTEASKG